LRQIVVNLVGNALKFTERGEVMVRVENSRWVDGDAELLFSIVDTGIGIPADRKDTIFSAFSQADYSTTRRFGGTGLGLAITQQLVILMKGDIRVESEMGKGSAFRFSTRFGYRKVNEPQARDYTVESFKGLRVLVLDAHPNSLRITTELLSNWQMKADPVRDVASALSELRRARAEGNPYDLFVADAVRPESPGMKLAAAVDSYPELAEVRVVLLVSSPRRGEVDRAQHVAIRATLIKPVTARSMRVAVAKALEDQKQDSGMSVPKSSSVPPMRQLTVLIAEDNAVNQRLAMLNLEGWGHQVMLANDGQEAVDAYRAHTVDLILMDLQMPRLSGFEATTEIRRMEKLTGRARTPILALSANVLKGVRDECAKVGMDGYVSKPVRQQELVEGMTSVIPNLFIAGRAANPLVRQPTAKSSAAPAPQPVAAPAPAAPAPGPLPVQEVPVMGSGVRRLPIPPSRPSVPAPKESAPAPREVAPIPVATQPIEPVRDSGIRPAPIQHAILPFDEETLMQNLGGDRSMLAEVIRLCRDSDAPRLLKDLASALAKGDCAEAGKAAHGLKGMVGAFNATDAWKSAKNLEASAREGKMEVLLTEADEFVRTLRALVESLEAYANIEHAHLGWI
jgi:CheY-like chemotaxis protein